MSVSIETLGIDRLSVGERLDLIEKIWDSLPEQLSLAEIPAWHRDEIAKRRAAAVRADGRPWREVLDPLEGKP
jgi:putative addiction module component (TIGR02574 family)